MSHKAIVLDANILIRAVLGVRVRELLVELYAVCSSKPCSAARDADDWLVCRVRCEENWPQYFH
jgi:hypothetical protein